MFLRRMLWRQGEMFERAEAVVALLGPPGSGKSAALAALAEESGGTVVHVSLDFADPVLSDPVAAVAFVALTLMDTWSTLLRPPTFHRVGRTLLALNENLSDGLTANALSDLMRRYVHETRADRATLPVPASAAALAATLHGIDAAPKDDKDDRMARQQARPAIATLLADAVGWPGRLRNRRVTELDDPAMLASLVAVSRTRRREALTYLMRALLADIQENAARLTVPPARCRCLIPREEASRRHQHAWVLLADNLAGKDGHTDAGRRFLAELIRARHARAAGSDDRRAESDPLLVVAAVDEWTAGWVRWWCEPWRADAPGPDRQRIPLFSAASRDQWSRHTENLAGVNTAPGANTAYGWYPVWLDSLAAEDVEALGPTLARDVDAAAFGDFLRRLSGAWPAAVLAIRDQYATKPLEVAGRDPVPRSMLRETGERGEEPLWERSVSACLPGALPLRRPWRAAPAVVAVSAHLSEPERATDDLDPDLFPDAAQTLRRLRTKLWISTFHARPSRLWAVAHGAAAHPAVVHPWLARCLLTGLATESDAAGPVDDTKSLWEKLFTDLATPASGDTARMSVDRTLFHDLACDKVDLVVRMLAARFDTDDHRSWIGLLDHVTSAPCQWPDKEPTADTVARLTVDDDPHRTPVEAAVRNLVVLLWLYRDPLTVPEPRWDTTIHDNLQRLINISRRADVTALDEAAAQFA